MPLTRNNLPGYAQSSSARLPCVDVHHVYGGPIHPFHGDPDAGSAMRNLGLRTWSLNGVSAAMPIKAAQYAHELFVRKALENIAAGDSAKHDFELDHPRCAFGQWYDAQARKMFASMPQFKDMENPHAQVHQIASQIQAALATGHQDEAIRQGEALSLAKENIIQKLDALREVATKQFVVVS